MCNSDFLCNQTGKPWCVWGSYPVVKHICLLICRQIWHHLCWGPHPWDLHSWKELQARQQLPVALQAVVTPRRYEQEDHTLCGGRRRRQQGGSDQQNDQEDELKLWWVVGTSQVYRVCVCRSYSVWLMMHILFSPSYRLWWKPADYKPTMSETTS